VHPEKHSGRNMRGIKMAHPSKTRKHYEHMQNLIDVQEEMGLLGNFVDRHFLTEEEQDTLMELRNGKFIEDLEQRDVYNFMAEKCDRSLLKSKDLKLFEEVMNYLKGKGLDVKIAGSVVSNAIDFNPRQYKDIDIIVKGPNEKMYEANIALARAAKIKPNSAGLENAITAFKKGTIIEWDKPGLYVDVYVDNRYKIQRGKTKIDVCLAGNATREMTIGSTAGQLYSPN